MMYDKISFFLRMFWDSEKRFPDIRILFCGTEYKRILFEKSIDYRRSQIEHTIEFN